HPSHILSFTSAYCSLSHFLVHRYPLAFPTRRSSDLEATAASTSGALASERFAERIQSAQTGGVVDTERVNLLAGRAVKALNDIIDRKSTRLNSSHVSNSYAVFCLKKTIQS